MSAKVDKDAKPHFSASQLATLGRCAIQWEFRYVKKMKRPPGSAAIIGKGVDGTIGHDLTAKMSTGALLPDGEIADLAAETTRNQWAGEEPMLSEEEREIGVEKVKGAAVDTAVALARLHHGELAPKLTPVSVQRPFRVELRGFPYDFVGYWDVETREQIGKDGPVVTAIRDTKCVGKSPSETKAERDLQMIGYSFSKKVIDGAPPDFVAMDHLVKNIKPKLVTVTATPDDEDHRQFLRRIEVAAKVVESGVFMPPNPDAWWCSRRFCGYWDSGCAFGAKGRSR